MLSTSYNYNWLGIIWYSHIVLRISHLYPKGYHLYNLYNQLWYLNRITYRISWGLLCLLLIYSYRHDLPITYPLLKIWYLESFIPLIPKFTLYNYTYILPLAVSVSSGLGRRLRRIRAAHAWVRRKSAVIALVCVVCISIYVFLSYIYTYIYIYSYQLWYLYNFPYNYLVGGWPTPLKNTSSSVGINIPFPTELESQNPFHGSSHQSDYMSNVNPGLINPGWLIVVVPPNNNFSGYWNATPQLNSRKRGLLIRGWHYRPKSWGSSSPSRFRGRKEPRLVIEGPGRHWGRITHLAPVVLDAVGQHLHLRYRKTGLRYMKNVGGFIWIYRVYVDLWGFIYGFIFIWVYRVYMNLK